MKKQNLITCFILLIVIILPVNAKGDDKIGGVRAGFHSSALFEDGGMLQPYGHNQNFYVGITREKRIVPILHYGLGLEYFQNGGVIDDDNKHTLHYLSIPVGVKLKLGPFFTRGGIAPSFKVGEKYLSAGEEIDLEEKAKTFDAPVFLGAGFNIMIITIEARYHWGLVELNNGVTSQYLQIGAGISF